MLNQEQIQTRIQLALYKWWFATIEEDGQSEPDPLDMAPCICGISSKPLQTSST
jgi:hypothetical protein